MHFFHRENTMPNVMDLQSLYRWLHFAYAQRFLPLVYVYIYQLKNLNWSECTVCKLAPTCSLSSLLYIFIVLPDTQAIFEKRSLYIKSMHIPVSKSSLLLIIFYKSTFSRTSQRPYNKNQLYGSKYKSTFEANKWPRVSSEIQTYSFGYLHPPIKTSLGCISELVSSSPVHEGY